MTLIAGKLIGFTVLAPIAGLGVAYPAIKLLNANQTITYKNLQDFKNNCLVSIVGGEQGQSSETNKRLLVCPIFKNSEKASFYFYDTKNSQDNVPLKEVQKFTVGEDLQNITLILKGSSSEIISVSIATWNDFKDTDLKENCKVELKDDGSNKKQLRCDNKAAQDLQEFEFSASGGEG